MSIRSGIALVSLSLGFVGVASSGEVARQWLDRMNTALDEQTYAGTFVRITDQGPVTYEIAHRFSGGSQHERIICLDGAGREIIRHDDDVHVIYPDRQVVQVGKVGAVSPMITTLPGYSQTLEANYELREFDTDRVAGRQTQIISISPRDDYRYGYLLWLDSETTMPLRFKLWNEEERVIEEIFFTNIDFPAVLPDSAFTQTSDTSQFSVKQTSKPTTGLPSTTPWVIDGLPAGFELTASMMRSMTDAEHPVHHLVYSDGLVTVSVFVTTSPRDETMVDGLHRVGATSSYTMTRDGLRVIAMGEVPPRTVEAIATSLRAP